MISAPVKTRCYYILFRLIALVFYSTIWLWWLFSLLRNDPLLAALLPSLVEISNGEVDLRFDIFIMLFPFGVIVPPPLL